MKTDDALKHFGTLERVAATLGISVSAVSQWGKIIHEKNAYRVLEITKGN